jgi:hypothetical protein
MNSRLCRMNIIIHWNECMYLLLEEICTCLVNCPCKERLWTAPCALFPRAFGEMRTTYVQEIWQKEKKIAQPVLSIRPILTSRSAQTCSWCSFRRRDGGDPGKYTRILCVSFPRICPAMIRSNASGATLIKKIIDEIASIFLIIPSFSRAFVCLLGRFDDAPLSWSLLLLSGTMSTQAWCNSDAHRDPSGEFKSRFSSRWTDEINVKVNYVICVNSALAKYLASVFKINLVLLPVVNPWQRVVEAPDAPTKLV